MAYLRRASIASVPLFGFLLAGVAACNDSGGGDPIVEPDPISLATLAADLRQLRTGVIEEGNNSSQVSTLSLADSIAKAMAKGGVPVSAAVPGRPVDRSAITPVLGLIARPAETLPLSWAEAPRAPPAITCIANATSGWWALDPTDKYGPVSAEATRFELYQIQSGHWGSNPTPINGFVDVFAHPPRQQASETGGAVNVLLQGVGGTSSFSFPLSGTSTPNVLDLVSSGGFFTKGSSTLSFNFGITNTTITNTMTVNDLVLSTLLTIDFSSVATALLKIERGGADPQVVEYSFQFDRESALQAVTGGTVTVDGQKVADFGAGSRFTPTFSFGELLSAAERPNVTDVYVNASALDSRVTDMFTFAHCVGSDDPNNCQVMVTRLLSYGR